MASTPADLITWARALYSGTTLLPPKQKAELMTLISTKTAKPLVKPTADDSSGFGLGVAERYDPKFGTFWFYQGETLGFRASHIDFPNFRPCRFDFRQQPPDRKRESHGAAFCATLCNDREVRTEAYVDNQRARRLATTRSCVLFGVRYFFTSGVEAMPRGSGIPVMVEKGDVAPFL